MLILAVKVVAIFYISFGNMQNSHRALADLDICQMSKGGGWHWWIFGLTFWLLKHYAPTVTN